MPFTPALWSIAKAWLYVSPLKSGCGLSPGLGPLVSSACANSKTSWKKYGISSAA